MPRTVWIRSLVKNPSWFRRVLASGAMYAATFTVCSKYFGDKPLFEATLLGLSGGIVWIAASIVVQYFIQRRAMKASKHN